MNPLRALKVKVSAMWMAFCTWFFLQSRFAPVAKRLGITAQEGSGILVSGIFLIIFVYFFAYSFPAAAIALSTQVWTSVNTAVSSLAEGLFLIVVVFIFILIPVAILKKVME